MPKYSTKIAGQKFDLKSLEKHKSLLGRQLLCRLGKQKKPNSIVFPRLSFMKCTNKKNVWVIERV